MGLNEDLGDRENVGNYSLSALRIRQTKRIHYKLSRPDLHGDYCVFQNLDSIPFEIDNGEIGDQFLIEIVEMTEEEFEDLEEFEGW